MGVECFTVFVIIFLVSIVVWSFRQILVEKNRPIEERKQEYQARAIKAQANIKAGRVHKAMRIKMPAVPWDAQKAIGMMTAFYQLRNIGDICLQIYSRAGKPTEWRIIVFDDALETIRRIVLSFYPQAEIVVDKDPWWWGNPGGIRFGLGVEFFAPLISASDLKLDPLAAIVGAMSNLESNGKVVSITYEVTITDPTGLITTDYYATGMEQIHREQGGVATAVVMSFIAKRPMLPPLKNPDVYQPQFQRLFEEKLNSPLREVSFRIEAYPPDDATMSAIISALSQFNHPLGNGLVVRSGNVSHPIVVSPQEVASLWHVPSQDIMAPGVERASGVSAALPAELIAVKYGLLLGNNNYQGVERKVFVAEPDRITHMNIVGKTRVGKTTFMHNLIHQDIKEGRGVGVIDPHGDLVRNILEASIPPEREKDVVLFDLADTKRPMALNLLSVPPGVPNHAAVGMTLGVMKKIFAEQWSATRMEDALYSALAVLVTQPGATIRDVPKLFFDDDFRYQALQNTTDKVALEYWQEDYGRMSENYRMEVARPIMNRIRTFYRNPVIEQMVVQPTSIEFRSIMDERKIFLASLAGEATQAESAIIGALLISKIQMAAMSRASIPASQRQMYYLYIDEVQNFITTSLSTMFSEAAKYGLSLVVANQYLGQLEGGTLDAILGNTGTTVMFACGSQDAEDLGRYVKPAFNSQTLMNLDRFQALVKMQQSGKSLPAFSIETPPPVKKPADANERVQRMKQQVQEAPVVQPGAPEVIDIAPSLPTSAEGEVPKLEL